jgi:NAD(P)-dependent dehydrogenase (short-subunit alcohol dehydrogenase family)
VKGLAGRTALVTGGTGLIGGEIARRLADEGARVFVASRSAEKADAWRAAQAAERRQRLLTCRLDLTDAASITRALDALASAGDLPDIFIAAASAREGLATPAAALGHGHFTGLFSADVAGHYLCARGIVERRAGRGEAAGASFVWLSSIYADVGVDHRLYPEGMAPTPITYAATKSAVRGLVRNLAAAWGGQGVRVNAVVSGGVQNPDRQPGDFAQRYAARTMLRRMARPEEIAAATVFLASHDASYVTGASLCVDGGFTAW